MAHRPHPEFVTLRAPWIEGSSSADRVIRRDAPGGTNMRIDLVRGGLHDVGMDPHEHVTVSRTAHPTLEGSR